MTPPTRRQTALVKRIAAADLAANRHHPLHVRNADETTYKLPNHVCSYISAFTKGLPHHLDGRLVSPHHFQLFVHAVQTGHVTDIAAIPLGPPHSSSFRSGIAKGAAVRAWESMAAGNTFDLQGPDAQAVTMPPCPRLNSHELVTEMTELYYMALLRDVPFTHFNKHHLVQSAVHDMNHTHWTRSNRCCLPRPERRRHRSKFTTDNIFRGVTPGDITGPYISQFLLVGTKGLGDAHEETEGYVQYGATRIDQRVRTVEPKIDYMTTWAAYLDVQNGADLRRHSTYAKPPSYRFISTPRDLATYVHYDALYQAYLNACIILLDINAPYDGGLPFTADDAVDKQQGFATFGAPHVLTLVTEVATRALKAVRFQKYAVHRRLRPEAVGGLLEQYRRYGGGHSDLAYIIRPIRHLADSLSSDLMFMVAKENGRQNSSITDNGHPRSHDEGSDDTHLLSMAYAEGSPMHPSYGAGHATVAGACVTILKAFFDHTFKLPFAYVSSSDGRKLKTVKLSRKLTVEDELNKLAANISIGRSWAGVHYYSDYVESIRLGEEVAIGMLKEQKLTYSEKFTMTIPKFDGSVIEI
uniref:Vanadium-dependent haloperoxidase n=1 Tax=Asparagopsis taxiformis TaxID=260499 RepID=A0A6M8PSH6_9FLOR|nr:vanadium-dependent haloperoxidase [Asparagopsis taxiformis]